MLVVTVATAPASAKSSNPAFLGVGMDDVLTSAGNVCMIKSVTKGSGADAAGLRPGDSFVTIEGAPVANCTALVQQIQSRESCETVKIEVRRSTTTTTATAQLCSRADVMRQRIVGQQLPAAKFVNVDNAQSTDDLAARGKTTIVGWYDDRNCSGCEQVFSSIDRWARRKSSKKSPINVVATTRGRPDKSLADNLVDLQRVQRSLDLPLFIADPDTFSDLAITDIDRIHFMVIDCHGIVQYAAPLAPEAEDQTAVLDELYAAAEQAARRR